MTDTPNLFGNLFARRAKWLSDNDLMVPSNVGLCRRACLCPVSRILSRGRNSLLLQSMMSETLGSRFYHATNIKIPHKICQRFFPKDIFSYRRVYIRIYLYIFFFDTKKMCNAFLLKLLNFNDIKYILFVKHYKLLLHETVCNVYYDARRNINSIFKSVVLYWRDHKCVVRV